MSIKSLIVSAAIAAASASAANAATVYFNESGTAPTVGVPNVNLSGTAGGTVSGTLYAWIDLNPSTEGYSGVSLSVAATTAQGAGTITAASITQTNNNPDNSVRWDTHVATPNTNGNLVTNSTQLAISGTGLNQQDLESALGIPASTPDAVLSATANDYRLFALNYTATVPATGTPTVFDIFLKLGSARFGVDGPGNTVGFGSPSDLIQVTGSGATVGAASAQPDAVITVTSTPEPTSVALLGLGSLAALRRKRNA